ncbi:MAG: hypothetical protein ACC661_02765, partial [Verrucomicrobiales bacterium]
MAFFGKSRRRRRRSKVPHRGDVTQPKIAEEIRERGGQGDSRPERPEQQAASQDHSAAPVSSAKEIDSPPPDHAA